jgi:PAS domain S-box-containing protein
MDPAKAPQPAAWHAQAELLNEMSRMAKVGGWEFYPDTGQVVWTDEVARIHDLDPAHPATVQFCLNFYPGESRSRIEQAVQAAVTLGQPYDLELAFRSAKGRLKWVRTMGRPVQAGGRVVKVWGTMQDITARVQAEQTVRLSEEKFAKVFHSSPDAIVLTELDTGRIAEANEAFEALSGYARAEVLGHHVRDFNMVTPTERERFAVLLREQGQIRRAEFIHRNKAGQDRLVLVSADLITIDGKQHAITTLHDITERRQAEDALRVSEERYRLLAEHTDDFVFLNDIRGHRLYISPSYYRVTGWTPEESQTGDWSARLHPDDVPLIQRTHAANLAGQASTIEHRIRCRDGAWRWVEAHCKPVLGSDGQIQHLLLWSRDITERKRAESQIQHFNEVLRAIRNIGELIHHEKDPQRLLQQACEGLVQTRGYVTVWAGRPEPDSKLVTLIAHAGAGAGFPAHAPITWDDSPSGHGPTGTALRERRPAVVDDIATDPCFAPWRDPVMAAGAASIASVPLLHGERLFGALTVKANRVRAFDAEELRLLSALASDLALALHSIETEQHRKQAEEEALRLATAVEQAAECIVITDAAGLIQYVNPVFERITGYTRAEAIGQNPRILKSGSHDAAFYRQMWDILQRGEIWSGHFINRRKDGTLYEEEGTISPVRNPAGQVTNYVAIKRDVTAEMSLQLQLNQSQKMETVGQLAGGVAHDFNNIVQTILGYCELLLKNTPETDERHSDLREIQRSGERAATLTRQLLAFSRKQMLMPRIHDLNDIVVNFATMLTRLIGENVQLKLDLAPDLPRVKVDSGQMDQTLINLALNARDAMPQGGQLRISTTNIQLDADDLPMHPEGRIGSFVCLAITDNGVGMSREIQAHIFEPFFTTKEQGKGSGLGLATVYGIVKQHDGWITVYSEPGRGTSFRMYLPALAGEVAGAPHDGAAAPVAPPALGHGERILLIEDDPLVRRMAQQMLNRRGYRTIAVSSCAEAHAAYNSQFDLVFSDVILPDGNGLELARQLQLRRPNLRCILTSGYADIHERWPEIEQQRWPFLVKPYSQADLLHALAVALAHD